MVTESGCCLCRYAPSFSLRWLHRSGFVYALTSECANRLRLHRVTSNHPYMLQYLVLLLLQKCAYQPPNTMTAYWAKGTCLLLYVAKDNTAKGEDLADPAANIMRPKQLILFLKDVKLGKTGLAMSTQGRGVPAGLHVLYGCCCMVQCPSFHTTFVIISCLMQAALCFYLSQCVAMSAVAQCAPR